MIRIYFDHNTHADLPDETPACIDTDALDMDRGPGLNPARRPVVMRPLARFRGVGLAFVRREGEWVSVRVEGWPEEASRLRGELERAGLRYRVSLGVQGAFYAAADQLHAVLSRTREWVSSAPLAGLRGYGSMLATKLTPCRCRPGIRLFCDRKRPPLLGDYFQRECDCACHEGIR